MERNAVKQLREIWTNTVPKIFEIARNEANSFVEALLEDGKSDASAGKSLRITCFTTCGHVGSGCMHIN